MSFRSIARDIRDSFGNLSRRSFDVRLHSHHRGKSHGSFHELSDQPLVIQSSRWANLPPELLFDVIRRLEESENTWPARKHVVACAAVCRSWRSMCKEIVRSPEICGKLTFPVSLKQVVSLTLHCLCRKQDRIYILGLLQLMHLLRVFRMNEKLILISLLPVYSRGLVMGLFSAS